MENAVKRSALDFFFPSPDPEEVCPPECVPQQLPRLSYGTAAPPEEGGGLPYSMVGDAQGLFLFGPERSGKSNILFNYAINSAKLGRKVTVLCPRQRIEVAPPHVLTDPSGVPDEALSLLELKYVDSDSGLREYLAHLHLLSADRGMPEVLIVDDWPMLFFGTGARTPSLPTTQAMVFTLSLLNDTVRWAKSTGRCLEYLVGDDIASELNTVRMLRWVPAVGVIYELKGGTFPEHALRPRAPAAARGEGGHEGGPAPPPRGGSPYRSTSPHGGGGGGGAGGQGSPVRRPVSPRRRTPAICPEPSSSGLLPLATQVPPGATHCLVLKRSPDFRSFADGFEAVDAEGWEVVHFSLPVPLQCLKYCTEPPPLN